MCTPQKGVYGFVSVSQTFSLFGLVPVVGGGLDLSSDIQLLHELAREQMTPWVKALVCCLDDLGSDMACPLILPIYAVACVHS